VEVAPDRSDDVTRGPRVKVTSVVLALVLLALLVSSGLFGREWREAARQEDREAAVLDAARDQAIAFTTLDYRDVDEDVQRVLDGSTGAFREQYEASLAQLKELSVANQAVSEGTVLEAGLVSLDDRSARVIVVADSQVTNSSTRAPQPRHYRLQLDLSLANGEWLTSDLQFVG
jgi:Mce-associated membrane protein